MTTNWIVEHGDCVERMRTMPDASVDAVVTDPPYGLSREPDVAEVLRHWLAGDDYVHRGGGFMGKTWDSFVPGPTIWRECLRVLKPGGHLLAFSGSRTSDLQTVALRIAGFEIRDSLQWLYGSGFPKSLNVSKAIDKARTEDIEPVRVICRYLRAAMEARGFKSRDVAPFFGCDPRLVDHWAARDTDSQPSLPTNEQWQRLLALLDLDGSKTAEVERLNARKGEAGEAWKEAEVIGDHAGNLPGLGGERFNAKETKVKAPATDAARQWVGWGTALKPGHEPIVLARKPLEGTVAVNVQAHSTGAINIDGCRLDFVSAEDERESKEKNRHADFGTGARANRVYGKDGRDRGVDGNYNATGRWPANVLLDEEAAAVLGEAARFFYTAKASGDEREADGIRNTHPTVKPVVLMRWLCRLVTPPGGLILDPFCGSGSTGVAALIEGFRFHGIERESESVEIARRRIIGDSPLFNRLVP